MYRYEPKGKAGDDYRKWILKNMREGNDYQVPFDYTSYMRCLKEWFEENGFIVRIAKYKSKDAYTYKIEFAPKDTIHNEIFEYAGEPIISERELIQSAYDKMCELYNQKVANL